MFPKKKAYFKHILGSYLTDLNDTQNFLSELLFLHY